MVALCFSELECCRERRQHLRRGAGCPCPFQPFVVTHRHLCQRGYLFAAQSGCATSALAWWKYRFGRRIFWSQILAAAAEKVCELLSAHSSMLSQARQLSLALLVRGLAVRSAPINLLCMVALVC